MNTYKKFTVPNRAIYPRQVQGRVVGYSINIPSSFSEMIDTKKRYIITLEVEEE